MKKKTMKEDRAGGKLNAKLLYSASKLLLSIFIVCGWVVVGHARAVKHAGPAENLAGTVSAEDQVRNRLHTRGISEGIDKKKGSIVAIGSQAEDMESREAEMQTEVFRQRVYKKALLDALSKIVRDIQSQGKESDSRFSTSFELTASNSLHGIHVLTSTESFNPDDHAYEMSLAVVWSTNLMAMSTSILARTYKDSNKVGRHSLVEWIDQQSHPLGAKSMVDNMGNRWLIGTVTVDDSMREFADQWYGDGPQISNDDKLRAFALSGITQSLVVDVDSTSKSVQTEVKADGVVKNRKEGEEFEMNESLVSHRIKGDKHQVTSCDDCGTYKTSISSEVSLHSKFQINPKNHHVNWFVRKGSNPVTGKKTEVWFGCVRCADIFVEKVE